MAENAYAKSYEDYRIQVDAECRQIMRVSLYDLEDNRFVEINYMEGDAPAEAAQDILEANGYRF